MSLKSVFLGSLCLFPIMNIHAAAMDQSGQSILPFLEDGNYAEVGITIADPKISGKIRNRSEFVDDPNNLNTGNMASSVDFYNFALKFQLRDDLSFGILSDQPFAAKTLYPQQSNNSFFDYEFSHEGTGADVETQNLSILLGYTPIKNFQVYGGPVYQEVKGKVLFRGKVFTEVLNGYNANFRKDGETGWLAGMSYQVPEIALKAAITYRSKIKYKLQVDEDIFGQPLQLVDSAKVALNTPQSINIDFQSGIAAKTLVYANLRWVNWKKFETRPLQFGAITELITTELSNGAYTDGFNLVDYYKDQYSAVLGLGHQFTEKWSAVTDIGWDSGTGGPASILGPMKESWALGVGAQFNPAPHYFLAAGVKYFWLGNVTAEDGTYHLPIEGIKPIAEQADFKNSHAVAYALKIGYRF